MPLLQAPRGCPDWLSEDFEKSEFIFEQAKKWAEIYNFKGFKSPIFEHAEVFTKTLGDSSDIVTKEMYSLNDKNGELFILRPEATAPLVRLFLSNKLQRSLPLKMFTYGPMFRYERPQKGRQRQFHQIGVEHLGAPKDLFTHFETLSMGWNFIKSLDIKSDLKILVNAIGSNEERALYKKSLLNFLKPLKEQLSEDSQKRLETNPLRILDSKSKTDQELLKKAPQITDSISSESKKSLQGLIDLCKAEGIAIEHDPFLVRGLDYYNDLVFEIISLDGLGAQNTVLAGGRYDHLVESMGGAPTNAIGWGAGLERLMLLSEDFKKTPSLLCGIVSSELEERELARLTQSFRASKLPCFVPRTGNFSKKMTKCQKAGCTHVILIGEEEISKNTLSLKDLSTGEQIQATKDEVFKTLRSHLTG